VLPIGNVWHASSPITRSDHPKALQAGCTAIASSPVSILSGRRTGWCASATRHRCGRRPARGTNGLVSPQWALFRSSAHDGYLCVANSNSHGGWGLK
jgi:hypothetical protein